MSTPKNARHSTAARQITVRRPGLEFDEGTPRYFVAGDVARSHVAAMLSAVFPEGEDFFVRSVRNYRDQISDPELKAQVAKFIGQEAVHGREHREFNQRLNSLGYPTRFVDRRTKVGLAVLGRTAPKAVQLAVTAGLEHYTAALAETLLRDEAALDEFMSPETRALFAWHALEETEHKAVAFDVFQDVVGDHRVRVGTMTAIHVGFLLAMTAAVAGSLVTDREARRNPLRTLRSLLGLRTHPFFQKELRRRLLDYNRRDFHPDDHETDEIMELWRARYDEGLVPAA